LVVISVGFACMGAVAHFLGQLAGVTRRWDKASRHFEAALEVQKRIGAWPALAGTQYEYARMLQDRDRPDDRPQARNLLAQSLQTAEELGMAWLRDRALAASASPT
jgi:uncharacterized protein HemY